MMSASPAQAKEGTRDEILEAGASIGGLIMPARATVKLIGDTRSGGPTWRLAELKMPAAAEWCGVPLAANQDVRIARWRFPDWSNQRVFGGVVELLNAAANSYALERMVPRDPATLFLYFDGTSPLKLGALELAPARTVVECRFAKDGKSELAGIIQATLLQPYVWREWTIPARTDLTWYPQVDGGGLSMWQEIDEARTFGNVLAPKGVDVGFHPNGHVAFVGELAARHPNVPHLVMIEVATAAYRTLKCTTRVEFYANGVLAYCTFLENRPLRVGELECRGDYGVYWHDNGKLSRCNLTKPHKVGEYLAVGSIALYPSGVLKEVETEKSPWPQLRFKEDGTRER